MSTISFKAKPFKVHSWTLIQLPKEASAKLPSRGMNMVAGTIDGTKFQAPLEPDGYGSHWFKVENIKPDSTVSLEVEPLKTWTKPDVPDDLKKALAKVPKAKSLWEEITPKAQWEWIRWIRATNKSETRERRLEVACSKLKSGMRRPCCFNSNMCTEMYVSHNGALLDPAS